MSDAYGNVEVRHKGCGGDVVHVVHVGNVVHVGHVVHVVHVVHVGHVVHVLMCRAPIPSCSLTGGPST